MSAVTAAAWLAVRQDREKYDWRVIHMSAPIYTQAGGPSMVADAFTQARERSNTAANDSAR